MYFIVIHSFLLVDSAVLIQRHLLVSSTYVYAFQSCDKMLHLVLIGYMLVCLAGELSMLWSHCTHEQEVMFHLWDAVQLQGYTSLNKSAMLSMWFNSLCSVTVFHA